MQGEEEWLVGRLSLAGQRKIHLSLVDQRRQANPMGQEHPELLEDPNLRQVGQEDQVDQHLQ